MLHDHPNIVVLSRVLYGELEELNVDGNFDRMDVDSDAVIDDDDRDNGDTRRVRRRHCARPLKGSRNTIEPRILIPCRGGEQQAALPPVLHVHPNRNPMGATLVGGRGGGCPTFIISATKLMCLYPREGNCHAFVIGPLGSTVLDILFLPYDDNNDRGCTY